MAKELLYGMHAVTALLEREPGRVTALWVLDSRHDERLNRIIALAEQAGVSVVRAPRAELDARTEAARHQGVVAAVSGSATQNEHGLEAFVAGLREPPFLLVLDGVQDPHNLGACLRSANAAGVHAVIVPKDRASGLTPVARKVASGAAEATPLFQVTSLARTLRWLKEQNIWLMGLTGEANDELYSLDFKGPLALVLGAEGGGLRRLTKEHCDFLAHIPMAGSVESLNVSVTAGVALFEAVRQRRGRQPGR